MDDVFLMEPSQPPHHLDSHPLDELWGDVYERMILHIFLEGQMIGWFHLDTENPLLVINMRGHGRQDVGHPIRPSPSSLWSSKFMRRRLSGVWGQDFLATHPPTEAVPRRTLKTLRVQEPAALSIHGNAQMYHNE